MMRSYVALAWAGSLVWMVACVNVDKPGKVAKCEQPGSNCTVDAAAAAQDADENDDAPALHCSEAGVSDGARDRVLDVPLAVFQDAAQDVARDATGDQQIGPCWGASGPVKAGAVCRAAVGLCDLDEVCDGIHADCPADQYAPTTTVCRKAVGDCDIAEGCTGSSPDCPVDAVMTAGTLCRKAAGACDVAESCSGTDPACPADGMVPPGSTCRPSTDSNQCDPAEVCTGTSVSCPADVIYARPAAPTAAKAAVGTIAGTASISWTAPAGGAPTGYNVKRSATPTSGYTILGTQPTTTSSPYTDSGLAGGATYYYVVSGVNLNGDYSTAFAKAQVLMTPPAMRSKKHRKNTPWDKSQKTKHLVKKLTEVEKHFDFYSALYRQYVGDLCGFGLWFLLDLQFLSDPLCVVVFGIALRGEIPSESHCDRPCGDFGQSRRHDDPRGVHRAGQARGQSKRDRQAIRHPDDDVPHGFGAGEVAFSVGCLRHA